MFKVDVFVAKDRAWERETIARGRRTGLTPDGSVTADLASAEDVILAKLEWFRAGDEEGLWRYVHGRRHDLGKFPVYGYAMVPPTPFLWKDWERYDVSRYVTPGSVSPEEGWRSVEGGA